MMLCKNVFQSIHTLEIFFSNNRRRFLVSSGMALLFSMIAVNYVPMGASCRHLDKTKYEILDTMLYRLEMWKGDSTLERLARF